MKMPSKGIWVFSIEILVYYVYAKISMVFSHKTIALKRKF